MHVSLKGVDSRQPQLSSALLSHFYTSVLPDVPSLPPSGSATALYVAIGNAVTTVQYIKPEENKNNLYSGKHMPAWIFHIRHSRVCYKHTVFVLIGSWKIWCRRLKTGSYLHVVKIRNTQQVCNGNLWSIHPSVVDHVMPVVPVWPWRLEWELSPTYYVVHNPNVKQASCGIKQAYRQEMVRQQIRDMHAQMTCISSMTPCLSVVLSK